MNSLLEKYFAIIKKFIPETELKSSVGLDIGSRSCKLIEILPNENSFLVNQFGVQVIEEGKVADAVKQLLSKTDIQTKTVATALSGQGTLIRYIEMPRMSLDDLRNSFAIEADRYFPFPKEQIYTDCFILDPKIRNNQMRVLVAAAKKDIVEQRLDMLTKLGLQTNFVGINSIALANVIHSLPQQPPASAGQKSGGDNAIYALLDIGEVTSNLLIMMGQLPHFTRDIFIGGRDLTKRISNVLGIDLVKAEAMKIHPGNDCEQVKQACDSVLSNLVSEIRLSFDYFVTENNEPVHKLYLTGGMSLLPGIVKQLSEQLDLTVELWNPFAEIEVSEAVSKEDLEKSKSQMAVALGLALYQY